jgi:hypothetical protein
LERLSRITETQREPSPLLDSEVSKPQYDPQDVYTTPSGPMVMINGNAVPLQSLDAQFVSQGWSDDGDVDFELTPEGGYVPGRSE